MKLAAWMMAAAAGAATAQVDVPDGFSVTNILPGSTPQRMAAIENPAYGGGVLSIQNTADPATVVRLQEDEVSIWGILTGYAPDPAPSDSVLLVPFFDAAGVLYDMYVWTTDLQGNNRTTLLQVLPDGSTTNLSTFNDSQRRATWSSGASMPEGVIVVNEQTGLIQLQAIPGGSVVNLGGSLPTGRTDFDIAGLRVDPTGRFGDRLIVSEADLFDNQTGLWYVNDQFEYVPLVGPFSLNDHRFRNFTFGRGGAFADELYLIDGDTVITVQPDGSTQTWATGFTSPTCIEASPDGLYLYVGDALGIHAITATTRTDGPVVAATSPDAPAGVSLTGGPGLTDLAITWSEPVQFGAGAITVETPAGDPLGATVSGSGSDTVRVTLDESLLAATAVVVVSEAVTSTVTGLPIDGDSDGVAGGEARVEFTHRCGADLAEPAGLLDLSDVTEFVDLFVNGCE